MSDIFRSTEEIRELFRSLGIEYIQSPRLDYPPLLGFDPTSTGYYRENREEFQELSQRYGAQLREGRTAPLYVRPAGDMGLGVFAAEDLPKGCLIGEYTGIVRQSVEHEARVPDGTWERDERYPTDYAWGYPDCFPDIVLEVDAAEAGNELRFVNHSFRPNLEVEHTVVDMRWAVLFVAARDIVRDEQLFVDYGDEYWTGGFRTLVFD